MNFGVVGVLVAGDSVDESGIVGAVAGVCPGVGAGCGVKSLVDDGSDGVVTVKREAGVGVVNVASGGGGEYNGVDSFPFSVDSFVIGEGD